MSTRLIGGYPRRRLTIAVIPGVVTALVAVIALIAIRRLSDSRHWLEHTHFVKEDAQDFLQNMVDAETGVRAYFITGNSSFLKPFGAAEQNAQAHLRRLRELTVDNPSQRRRVDFLSSVATSRFSSLRQSATHRDSVLKALHAAPDNGQSQRGLRQMDSVRSYVRAIQAEENRLLLIRDQRDLWNQWIAAIVMGLGGIVAVLVSLLINRILMNNATELADANVDLATQAQRLEEQATELESQATELEASAVELEATNVELEEHNVELEEHRDIAQNARAEAEQANAAKSRFLSVMSHELRTPLNAVTGYVDLIDAGVHGPVTEEQREDIRRIKRASGQLTSIISDILNFAKLEAGEVRFDIGVVHMHEALTNAITLMEPQALTKGIRFAAASCSEDIVASADRERVQQIVLNLLSNAVKYTPAGGEVQIACVHDADTVYLYVSDTGRGIAADDMQRIFEPFVQVPAVRHSPSEGVGLGLAISRDLARGMGGDITVQSRIGEGSVFEVTLPVAHMQLSGSAQLAGSATATPSSLYNPR